MKNEHIKEADQSSVIEMGLDGKVHCRICLEFNECNYKGKWVLKASFLNHAIHPIHLKAVANQNTFLTARAQELPDNYATTQDVVMDSPPKDRSVRSNLIKVLLICSQYFIVRHNVPVARL